MTVGTCHTIADAATNRESFYVAPIHYEGPERRPTRRRSELATSADADACAWRDSTPTF